MKLDKIEIHAFRSIDKSTISFEHDCLGLVGINESGKTNVLDSIKILDPSYKLKSSDRTKESRSNTSVRFYFSLTTKNKKDILTEINEFIEGDSIGCSVESSDKVVVQYDVGFNTEENIESRKFFIRGVKLNKDARFLKDDYKAGAYEIKVGKEQKTLKTTWVIDEKTLEAEDLNVEANNKLRSIIDRIEKLEIEKKLLEEEGGEGHRPITIDEELELELMNKRVVEEKISFDIFNKVREVNVKIGDTNREITETTKLVETSIAQKEALEKLANKTVPQKKDLTLLETNIKKANKQISKLNRALDDFREGIDGLSQPISENYSDDISIFEEDLGTKLESQLKDMIPEVIFWESNPEYILPSSIKISALLTEKGNSEIPRPLFNMFRIALGVENKSQFKNVLKDLSENGGKRSSANVKLNSKVNKYIKQVWEDYDQELKITVEQELIRIEVFDPTRAEEANFYELVERSQGCKTFLSFILTIGAETRTNLIENKILLLDEPETHLHPSGQRYLLKELRKISQRNIVVYATHSNHMIIRENYDQHLIVSKTKDRTELNLSKKDRIGYFMQEEVLYDALGVNLSSDLSTIEDFNFVFEGIGDIVLFRQYYEKVAKIAERPFKLSKTKFFHGGKCSDIKKAFTSRPIQLGTKWVFILDSDKAADDLAKFLVGRYKNYKDKDIFVFQYPKISEEGELEDLVGESHMLTVYEETFRAIGIEFDRGKIKKMIEDSKGYGIYSKDIVEGIVENRRQEFVLYFKNALNNLLLEKCKDLDASDKFKEQFPKYYDFVNDVLKQIVNKK